jgi:phosphotransferase system HPr-like phosphotransfer protein
VLHNIFLLSCASRHKPIDLAVIVSIKKGVHQKIANLTVSISKSFQSSIDRHQYLKQQVPELCITIILSRLDVKLEELDKTVLWNSIHTP